jgi:hypothetical protein
MVSSEVAAPKIKIKLEERTSTPAVLGPNALFPAKGQIIAPGTSTLPQSNHSGSFDRKKKADRRNSFNHVDHELKKGNKTSTASKVLPISPHKRGQYSSGRSTTSSPVIPTSPTKSGTSILHYSDRHYYYCNFDGPSMGDHSFVEVLHGDDYSKVRVPSQQIPPATFWTYLDPWLREIAEEDLEWLKCKYQSMSEEELRHFVIPNLGKVYSNIWSNEVPIANQGNVSSLRTNQKYAQLHLNGLRQDCDVPIGDSDFMSPAFECVPLGVRLLSSLVQEATHGFQSSEMQTMLPVEIADEEKEQMLNKGPMESDQPIRNPSIYEFTLLESRLKFELRSLGLLDEVEVRLRNRFCFLFAILRLQFIMSYFFENFDLFFVPLIRCTSLGSKSSNNWRRGRSSRCSIAAGPRPIASAASSEQKTLTNFVTSCHFISCIFGISGSSYRNRSAARKAVYSKILLQKCFCKTKD